MVMDSRLAERTWGWRARITLEEILDEIAHHAAGHPDWLRLSAPR